MAANVGSRWGERGLPDPTGARRNARSRPAKSLSGPVPYLGLGPWAWGLGPAFLADYLSSRCRAAICARRRRRASSAYTSFRRRRRDVRGCTGIERREPPWPCPSSRRLSWRAAVPSIWSISTLQVARRYANSVTRQVTACFRQNHRDSDRPPGQANAPMITC